MRPSDFESSNNQASDRLASFASQSIGKKQGNKDLPNTMDADIPFELMQIALTSADTILYQWDLDTRGFHFSENIDEVFPLNTEVPHDAHGWLALVHEDDRANLMQEMQRWQEQEGYTSNSRYRLSFKNKTVWVRQSGIALNNSNKIVGIIYFNCTPPSQDLRGIRASSVKLPEHAVQQHSTHELYPEALLENLRGAVRRCKEGGHSSTLLLLSVANFGMIINAYGHRTSERISKEIAAEICNLLEGESQLYRLQSDQYAIILEQCDATQLEDYKKEIAALIEEYGHHTSIGDLHAICAMGSQSFPTNELQRASEILDYAYIDLHKANASLPIAKHELPHEQQAAQQQMGLANYLRRAIQEDKLRLAFQPVIRSGSGEVAHHEALLRMIGDDGRISSAGPLIPVAEKMGMIDMVDHMVLDMVFKELDQAPNIRLAMNVSNLTTDNPHWLRHFQGLLRNRPDIASRLIIEITETAAHRDMRRTAYFVASMQEMGCTVALDDFGSGYTSFRQLKALSVDMVKIDGSFVKDMTENSDNHFFVKTLLDFTRCFGLESVAEFVETGETAKALMELGVDYQQGYYFGKPENFRSWLTTKD